MITRIGNLQIRDDFLVTIRGTIVAFRDDDEFLLQDRTGQVWVDADESRTALSALSLGDRVTVIGDLDDAEDFDARRILPTRVSGRGTRPFRENRSGSSFFTPPAMPPQFDIGALVIPDDFRVTISGTVVAFRDDDEFLLRDDTGEVWVDSDEADVTIADLAIGASVIVVGDLDDAEDFDAQQIFSQSEFSDPLVGDRWHTDTSMSAGDPLMAASVTDVATTQAPYPDWEESPLSAGMWVDVSGYDKRWELPLVNSSGLAEIYGSAVEAGAQWSAASDW